MFSNGCIVAVPYKLDFLEELPFFFLFFRIYPRSDRHTDATCSSSYSSRDVQNFHNGRGMIFTLRLVLDKISGNVS